ncbi:beta strand repeat-containing protein, partial [Hymenobacter agri]
YAVSTFLTPAPISGATATALAGIAVFSAAAPTVTTAAATTITSTSAVLGGNVTADGGATVTERGVVYSSTNTTPAIGSGTQNSNGTGTGSFSETITGLTPGTTYYVRAYAINSVGTSYGSVVSFTTTATVPTVITAAPSSVTTNSAVLGGNVTADGGASVSGRGVVYSVTSTNGTPAIGGTGVTTAANGSGTGSFSATISSLTPGTNYSVRAYATNSVGTSYGAVQNFTTTALPTVVSVTRLTPSPTATAQVSYRVVFSGSVTGVTTTNFTTTNSGTTVTGSSVSSTSGSGTTYTVVVNTGTGNGTLRLDVANSTGISPTVSNVPYTAGEVYTITKSFAAAPTLRIQAGGSASGNGDVTAFVDVVQVLQSGTTTAGANALQNGSFESNNVDPSGFRKATDAVPVVASPWSFTALSGVSRNGSAFGSTAADGDAVALIQSAGDNNAGISQNLAVPTGTYQVSFLAMQRNYTSKDQRLNVFVNDVFVGSIQPNGNTPPTYDTFTSASFSVTAPALTATVSTTSASPTSTSPIPFVVSFSQSVGTSFTAADVTVSGGTVTSGSFSGSGAGPYTFTVTPSGAGTVTVSLAANVANDANNTGNSASNSVSVQYQLPATAAPVVTAPANGSSLNTTTPAYAGTAAANSTVTVYVDGSAIGTTTATAGGTFSLTQPTALSQGSHTVFARAQSSGETQSVNSSTNNFTVDTVRPSVVISSSAGASGSTTATTPIPFTVTFSESVNGSFAQGDLTVTGGTISGFTAVSGTTFTFNVTPTSGGTTVTVNVQANVAQDAAGNGNTAAAQFTITYAQPVVATAQNVTVNLAANGSATLNASSVNNGSTGSGTLTYTIQKIARGRVAEGSTLTLSTPNGSNFTAIRFASYGTPTDDGNGNYRLGSCNAANSVATATNSFIGRSSGSMDAVNGASANNNPTLGDPCGGTPKALAVQAGYSADASSLSYDCSEASKTQYVLLTVTDGSGNTSTSVAQVTVNPAPTATITSATPNPATPGTLVTVSGTNLSGLTSATLNGAPVTATGISATGFQFTVPANATSGNLVVSLPCSQTLSQAFTVVTPAPVVTAPANGSLLNTRTPVYSGTAPANSTVTVYVDGASIGTTTATAGGSFSLTQPTSLTDGNHTVYATAQASGTSVSVNSNTNTFTIDATRPSVTITSSAGASGGTTTTSPIPFTVTFSESVNGSFVQGDVTVTNGAISGFTTVVAGTTFTFNVTPATPGTATTVTVPANVAQDAAGNFNTAGTPSPYALTFLAPAITVAPNSLPGGTRGVAYSQTLSASGGTAPYTFAITAGALPTGLSLTNGTIAGTPTVNGSFTFTVTATDASTGSGPYTGSRSYTLAVAAPTITLSPATVPNGVVGTPYSQTLTATGGTGPYTFAVTTGTLPAGLTLTAGGLLAGTPTTSGSSISFTVTATDAFGATGAQNYSILITSPLLVTWTGAVNTDWYTAGNWSPNFVPGTSTDATIPTAPSGGRFPAITSGTANVRNLTLNSGASLTQTGGTLNITANLTNNGTFQPTGGTASLGNTTLSSIVGSSSTRFWNLTVGANAAQLATSAGASVQRLFTLNGNFTTNGNPLTLESNASGTAMVVNNGSAAVVGTATVQRYITPDVNPNLGYRHVSAPISNATVASLTTGSFSPVVNPAYNTSATPTAVTLFPTVYGYDQGRLATTTNNLPIFDKGWFSPSSTGDALTVGQGYTVNLAAAQTWNFVGAPNNGTLTQTLNRNSGATAADAGLQLVGNPYPSPLDWSLVTAADRPNVDGIMYVFVSDDPTNPYTGSYKFYNNGIGTISPVLPLGQGFFVKVSAGQTSGSLSLKNSHRLTSYTNPTYHRTAGTQPLVHLTLQGAGNSRTDDAFVYFEAGATNGLDAQYDGEKLPNPSGLNLSSSLSATLRLCVNGLEPLTTTQRIVPLAVGVPAAGSYTLNAADVLNLA